MGSEGPDLTDKARQTVMGDLDDGHDLRWSINASAGDIYGEINRALASVQKVSSRTPSVWAAPTASTPSP